jgi:hypothetical protein
MNYVTEYFQSKQDFQNNLVSKKTETKPLF